MENCEKFKLTPEEDFQFGVWLKDGQLRFGPNGSRLLSGIGTAVAGLAIAGFMMLLSSSRDMKFNGYNVVNTTPLRILAFAILTYTSFYAWNAYRSGVVANAGGLQLRQGRHHATLSWSSIHAIDAHDQDDYQTTPAYGPNGFTAQPVNVWIVGFVQTNDGRTIGLPGFVSASRDAGETPKGKSAVEVKIAALRRFAAHTTNRQIDRTALTSNVQPMHTTSPATEMAVACGVLLCLYGLNCWAAGRWINPLFLAVGVVLYVGQMALNRRTTSRRVNRIARRR
jgi:hypothetical protein